MFIVRIVRLSEGVEWALHCCTVLALVPEDRALPAARLAEFHGVPTAYLAKHLQALSRAGVIESVPGQKGGYRLARPPGQITLYDVVAAIEGTAPAFRCTEIRQRGPAGMPAREYRAACVITQAMHRAEAAWRAELESRTVADLLVQLADTVHPKAAEKATRWFQEALR
jgi:Rrf2 family protein